MAEQQREEYELISKTQLPLSEADTQSSSGVNTGAGGQEESTSTISHLEEWDNVEFGETTDVKTEVLARTSFKFKVELKYKLVIYIHTYVYIHNTLLHQPVGSSNYHA